MSNSRGRVKTDMTASLHGPIVQESSDSSTATMPRTIL